MTDDPSAHSKHYYRIKGQLAEELLLELANKTFLVDWCYPNPKLPDGKELCDLLVVFDSTAIIWQAKSLKLGKDGDLNARDLEKNLRQLSGARRQLIDVKTPVTLENPRRAPEQFDPIAISEVFLISVLLGDTPSFQSLATHVKKHKCHVFTRDFTELVLNELDTIEDFCRYLREKERIREHIGSFILEGGEQELLAYYLLNDRSLAKLEGHTVMFLQEGIWDDLHQKPEYQVKREADAVSYVWDDLIERAHTGDCPEYERIARELARPSRFDRRCLAEAYLDAHQEAHDADSPGQTFRRVMDTEGMTVCFLFAADDVPRESRRRLLENLCFVARGKVPENTMVIGIATEMAIRRESTLDYCLLDIPEWGPEQAREMQRLQDETGILKRAITHTTEFTEYPDIPEGTDE